MCHPSAIRAETMSRISWPALGAVSSLVDSIVAMAAGIGDAVTAEQARASVSVTTTIASAAARRPFRECSAVPLAVERFSTVSRERGAVDDLKAIARQIREPRWLVRQQDHLAHADIAQDPPAGSIGAGIG